MLSFGGKAEIGWGGESKAIAENHRNNLSELKWLKLQTMRFTWAPLHTAHCGRYRYLQQSCNYQRPYNIYDIIIPGFLVSGVAICYLFELFKGLNFYGFQMLS